MSGCGKFSSINRDEKRHSSQRVSECQSQCQFVIQLSSFQFSLGSPRAFAHSSTSSRYPYNCWLYRYYISWIKHPN